MSAGIGGGGLPRVKEILAHLKAVADTVITAGAGKAAQVNMRDALGNELGTAAGIPLKVDVSGDFPDNIQGAVEQGNADVDPITPGHRVKPVKVGGHANAVAPAAVAENQVVDAWFDPNGRQNVALDDGADANQGATSDVAVAAGAAGTVSGKLRRISTDLNGVGTLLAALEALGDVGGDGIKEDIVAIAGTPPSTPGKLDVKAADGDIVVAGALADAAVAAGAAGTLSAKLRRLTADIDAIMSDVAALEALGVAGGAGIKEDIVAILGTAPTVAGKLDTLVADGDNVALGSVDDGPTTSGGVGSVSSKLRTISEDIDYVLTAIERSQVEPGDLLPTNATVIGLDNAGNMIVPKADSAGNVRVAPKTPPTGYAGTGTGAIAVTANPAFDFWFHSVTVHFDTAPATSESLTITINPTEGAAYSTVLYKVNPSTGSLTDILYYPADGPLLCKNGDTIAVAFPNTDARTHGTRIVVSPA